MLSRFFPTLISWLLDWITLLVPNLCYGNLRQLPGLNTTGYVNISYSITLVGLLTVCIIYGIILPIDFHIFQDGYCTTNQTSCGKSTDGNLTQHVAPRCRPLLPRCIDEL